MRPTKYQVLSWTSAACTQVGIYHGRAAAIAAAQAVPLTGGTIGAGFFPLAGSEQLESVTGTDPAPEGSDEFDRRRQAYEANRGRQP